MIASALTLLTLGLAPDVQRPRGLEPSAPSDVVAPTEPTRSPDEPADATTEPADASTDASTDATAGDPPTPTDPDPAAVSEPAAESSPAESGETFRVVAGNGDGAPPYYTKADLDAVRRRHGLSPEPAPDPRKVRWRCLIADPLCGFTIEVQALGAFAPRFRQGDVRERSARRWSSGRAQYDVWVNLPVLTEARGRTRYTRMTLGPKAGAIFSDTGDTWGNLGIVGRYWLGRGRFAPAIEFTSALAFKIAHRRTDELAGSQPRYEMQRGPVGITADVGLSIGGYAALVFGGQYDSPLAREDVPERFRTQASGMLFVGLRGNILWGGPAATAVMAHGLTQRFGQAPR